MYKIGVAGLGVMGANLARFRGIEAVARNGKPLARDIAREVIQTAVAAGIPVPALSSSLAYYDAYRSARLPANLTQGQRDFFGAHTYRRVDRDGVFHTDWTHA